MLKYNIYFSDYEHLALGLGSRLNYAKYNKQQQQQPKRPCFL
jgi:hypothetical protein